MEVEIKVRDNENTSDIAKYFVNDRVYEEQKRKLKKISKQLNNSREKLSEFIIQSKEIMKSIQNLDSYSEEIELQLKTKLGKWALKVLQQSSLNEKIVIEADHTMKEIKLQNELISISNNIITRLEQEVVDLKQDKQLIRKIVNEENINCKNSDSVHYRNEYWNLYFFIEPVIDFNITDKIVITDFVIYPLIFDLKGKDEVN